MRYQGSVALAENSEPGTVALQLFTGGDHILHAEMPQILAQLEPFLARAAP